MIEALNSCACCSLYACGIQPHSLNAVHSATLVEYKFDGAVARVRHFPQFMFRPCCDSELFTEIVAVVWLNRHRMLCLPTALGSEKSTAVSRSSRASHRSGDGSLVLAPIVLGPAVSLAKVRMSSRSMTAQIDFWT